MASELERTLDILVTVGLWTALLPIIAGLIRYKYLHWGLRVLILFSVVSLITDITSVYFQSSPWYSYYVPRIYTVCEFLIFSLFFIAQATRPRIRNTIIVLSFIFVGVEILDTTLQGIMKLDNFSIGIESLLLILYSIITLFVIMKEMVYTRIVALPQFWIITGILIYFGGSIFIFLSSNYLAAASAYSINLIWGIHVILAIVFYFLLSLALWKAKPESR